MRMVLFLSVLLSSDRIQADDAGGEPVEMQRGWLGVMTEELSPAMRAALGIEQGVLVADILVGSPAHRSGLLVGDVILKVDGEIINDGVDLRRAVRCRAGKIARVEVLRRGEARTDSLAIGTRRVSQLEDYLDLQMAPKLVLRAFERALSDVKPWLGEVTETEKLSLDSLELELESIRRQIRSLREELDSAGGVN